MPSLKGYSQELDYSYTPGVFPSLELMRVRPESAMRLLLSERAQGEGVEEFLIFRDGQTPSVTVDFTGVPQKEVNL